MPLQVSAHLVNWVNGVPGYSVTLVATGASGPVTFSDFVLYDRPIGMDPFFAGQAGFHNTGLSLNPATGEISGTPNVTSAPSLAPWSFGFAFYANDGFETAYLYTGLSIFNPGDSLGIGETAVNSTGVVGVPYGPGQYTGTGGTPGYTYAVTAGALPTGLSLDSATGRLTGTPTTPGTFTFTVTVTDSVADSIGVGGQIDIGTFYDGPSPQLFFVAFSSTFDPVAPCDISFTPADGTLPSAVAGIPYSASIEATEEGADTFIYEVTGGALPPGFTMNGSATGPVTSSDGVTIKGTTSLDLFVGPQLYQFTLTITSFDDPTCSIEAEFQLTVYPRGFFNGSASQLICGGEDLPWISAPSYAVPKSLRGSIVAPAIGVLTEIFKFTVPDGMYLAITDNMNSYSGTSFIEGSGGVIWGIDANRPIGAPMATGRPVAQFVGSNGDLQRPVKIGPVLFRGGDVVRYKAIITDPMVGTGAPNMIHAALIGWIYPMAELR